MRMNVADQLELPILLGGKTPFSSDALERAKIRPRRHSLQRTCFSRLHHGQSRATTWLRCFVNLEDRIADNIVADRVVTDRDMNPRGAEDVGSSIVLFRIHAVCIKMDQVRDLRFGGHHSVFGPVREKRRCGGGAGASARAASVERRA